MSVLTRKSPPQENVTAHQGLDAIDVRIREARAEANELDRQRQLAAQAATDADSRLIAAEGQYAAGQLSNEKLTQARKSYDAAKAEADRPWARDLQVAGAKVAALEDERRTFLSNNADELASEVTERAKDLQERIVANHEHRGALAAEINQVIAEWRRLGYTTSRFPLENLAQEWRREARVFDPGTVPLIVPESR